MKPKPRPARLINDNILSLLLNAYYQVDDELQLQLEEKGWRQFTHAQSLIFLNMAEGRERASDIARHMGISKQAVNRTIGELVELGLIELFDDPSDKRAKKLVLTEKGAEITRDATDSIAQVEKQLGEKLGKQKTRDLKTLLMALLNQ